MVGNLFHSPAQASQPDWNTGGDRDKEAARRTRNAGMDRLEREGFTVAPGHLPPDNDIACPVRLQGKRVGQAL